MVLLPRAVKTRISAIGLAGLDSSQGPKRVIALELVYIAKSKAIRVL